MSETNTKPYIDYETFTGLDIRMGTIRFVEPVEGTDKLLRFLIDFGPEVATMEYTNEETGETFPVRQVVSGIREYYPEYETLVGKTLLYIINLEPRTIRGVESQGMLMAVGDDECIFVVPETPVRPGSAIR
jgi:methionyl-tRNA synthetase